MSLPTMTGTARLIEAPELRFTAQGKAVVKVRLAFNSRKKDQQSGEWVDADSFFIDGTAFDKAAENIAESLEKGMEVVVSGRLKTEQWEKNGEKKSKPALLLDSIGPSLRFATARVTKASSSGGGRQDFQQARQQQAGSGDPWGAAAQQAGQGAGSGGWGEEPPF